MLSFVWFFLFNQLKTSAVLEPRTGYFRGLVGIENKNLSFEAMVKTKDLKMGPRGRPPGQGRPRGLQPLDFQPLDLIVMRFELQTSRSRAERVTARPTRRSRKKHIKIYNDHNT